MLRRHLAAAVLVAAVLVAGCAACASTAGSAAIGAACSEKTDCDSQLCLMASEYGASTGWTGGTCTASCSGTQCDSGVCVHLDSASLCLAACTAATDCRSGYVCDTTVGACTPDCNKGFSCGSKLTCQTDGTCSTAATSTTTTGACTSDNDCRTSDVCATTATTGCGCILGPAGVRACRSLCKSMADCPKSGKDTLCTPMGFCAPPAG